ncbi:hypothetical protein LIER_41191 [Lithospermum erythrorhizon]|uniref:Protein kinase domain-containing protein n=1 Tax=Lithospermum erythrorhizon TaxID=34254 RepID=A0AAV3R8L4_LITER
MANFGTTKTSTSKTMSKSTSKKEIQGLILDRYEIGKLLGQGTFAKVYLARNIKSNESVAIKPENILLDEDGNLKVSNFGLSTISDQINQDGLFHTFCGTPAYVALEVLGRKGYDAAKVDI